MDEFTVPPIITQFSEQITADCGHRSRVDVVEPYRRWRVVVESDRVLLTVDYTRRNRGRVVWSHSTLTLDGQRITLRRTYDDCIWVLKHPELYPEPIPVDTDFDEPVYPLPDGDITQAPALLQKAMRRIVDVEGITSTHVGHAGPRWTITAHVGDNCEIRWHYMVRLAPHTLKEKIYTRQKRHQEIFVDGQDRTGVYDETLERITGLVRKVGTDQSESPPGTGAARAAHQGARSNAVEIRKSTVSRT